MTNWTIFIVSDSRYFSLATANYFGRKFPVEPVMVEIPRKTYPGPADVTFVSDLFHQLCKSFDKHPAACLRKSVILFDVGAHRQSLGMLNPTMSNTDDYKYELASLVCLAFPEMKWLFFSTAEEAQSEENDTVFNSFNDIDNKFVEITGHSLELFDPKGTRNAVKKRIDKYSGPDRDKMAIVVDEEESYLFLHGYIAYILKYKSVLIDSQRLMNKLLADGNGTGKIDLSFEDLFLNYPDKGDEISLSNIENRDYRFPKLKAIDKRIFVTVGHHNTPSTVGNGPYLNSMRNDGKFIRLVHKPTGGIYNILQQSGLLKEYWRKRREEWNPPSKAETTGGYQDHSANGRLMLIAETLIDRAENIFHSARKPQDCIHGAMLALEAIELLAYKTPTTCLEAIALRHKLEVQGECMFYGVGYNIDVSNRLKDIEGEVDSVSKWFDSSKQKMSALNAKMSIVTDIMRIFHENGQFDEEQGCLSYVRKLNRIWFFHNRPVLNIIRPIRWYIEKLISSLGLFVLAIFVWPLSLGIISSLYCDEKQFTGVKTFSDHIAHAYITFFALQTSSFPEKGIAQLISLVLICGGFIHLGIFVSYLYSIIVRK